MDGDALDKRRRRVCVIGLDGASPDLMTTWVKDGKLPTFERLMREGAFGRLESVPNQRSAAAWTSFMTGRNPGRHGIYEFYEYASDRRRIRFLNGGDKDGPSIWSLLSDRGRPVGVMNVPMTYPAERVNGFVIAGLDAPGRRSRGFTHPPELLEELERGFGEYILEPGLTGLIVAGKLEGALQALWTELDQKAAIVKHLMKEKEWDLFVTVFRSLDAAQHCFWKYMDPAHPAFDSEEAQSYGDTIEKTYRRIDRYVGEVLEGLGEDTSLLIVSDHGFGPKHSATNQLNRWLEANGFLKYKKQSIKVSLLAKAHRAVVGGTPRKVKEVLARILPFVRKVVQYELCFSRIDWARTLAYSDTLFPNIWVNSRKDGPLGRKSAGTAYRKAVDALKEKLADCRDSVTGERVVERVFEREEIYHGEHAARAPDLLVRWHEGIRINGLAGVERKDAQPDTHVVMENPDVISGDHRLHGVLFARGEPIKRGFVMEGARLVDVAPTILYLLDEALPGDMDGKVLGGLFDESFLSENEIRFSDGTGERQGPERGSYTEEEARAMKERRRAVGYLEGRRASSS
jgi:predicted AlkP superfamily phosphohydrolase/phosphomutase